MRTPIFATCTTGITLATQRYMPPFGTSASLSTEAAHVTWIAPCAGTLSLFTVTCDAAPGTGLTRTFTVRKNGVDQALTVTFGATDVSKSDGTHSLTVAAGDLITLGTTASGATTSTGNVYSSMVFDAVTLGQSVLAGSGGVTALSASVTQYLPLIGTDTADTTAANMQQVVAHGGTIRNARVTLNVAPGASKTRTFTLVKNGVDTAIVVTVTGASTTVGSDTTHSVTIAGGDVLYWRSDVASSPATASVGYSVEYDPTTPGTSLLGYGTSNAPSTSAQRFQFPTGGDLAYLSAVTNRQFSMPLAGTITAEAVVVGTAPGGATSWQLGSVVNGTAQWEATVTGAATTNGGTLMFPGTSRAIAAGDLLSAYTIPAGGTPAAPVSVAHSFALFVQPTIGAGRMLMRGQVTIDPGVTGRGTMVMQGSATATVLTVLTAAAQMELVGSTLDAGAAGFIKIADVGACTATMVTRGKAKAAPWLRLGPTSVVAQVSGIQHPTLFPTAPVKAKLRPNRTEDYDVIAGDLGFPWDDQLGGVLIAWGDSFGTDWRGPFAGTTGNTGNTTLAASQGNVDVTTLDGTQSLTLTSGGGSTFETGFGIISFPGTGPGSQAAFTFLSRTGDVLNNCKWLCGSGIMTASVTALRDTDPRSAAGWRSSVLARHTDTDLRDGYSIDDFRPLNNGVATALVASPHQTDVDANVFTAGSTVLNIAAVEWVAGFLKVTTTTPHGITKCGVLAKVAGTAGLTTSADGRHFVVEIASTTIVYLGDLSFTAGNQGPGTANTGTLTLGFNDYTSDNTVAGAKEVSAIPSGGVAVPGNGVSGATRQYLFVTSFRTATPYRANYLTVLYSDDDGATWTSLKSTLRWENDATDFSGRIQSGWPVRRGGYVYLFVNGQYQTDGVCLMRVPEASIETKSAWQYWDGSTWQTNTPSALVPMDGTPDGTTRATYFGYREVSVTYNASNACWILTRTGFFNISMQSASRPEGPWSTAQVVSDGAEFTPAQAVYGGYIHPWSSVAPQQSTDLFFHVSSVGPYATFLMHATLGPQIVEASGAQLLARGAVSSVAVAIDVGTARSQSTLTGSCAAVTRVADIGSAAAQAELVASTVDLGVIKIADVGPAAGQLELVTTAPSVGRLIIVGTAAGQLLLDGAVDPAGIALGINVAGAARGVLLSTGPVVIPIGPVDAASGTALVRAQVTVKLVAIVSGRAQLVLIGKGIAGATPTKHTVTLAGQPTGLTLQGATRVVQFQRD